MNIRFARCLANRIRPFFGLLLLAILLPVLSQAQYFGQNKMRYKKLKFEVKETPHFELYSYLKNDSVNTWLAKEAEVWYGMHQQVFQDTFLRKNPIIIYNNHPEFQQTTAISGEISVGTGGVTEAFKQRVVMPLMQINQQTRHVLGHEMVHAFQYRVLMEGRDSTRLESVANIPLWMVEGMAEYFSIGKKDAFTAMWMRDAYARNDIPSLKQLTEQSHQYFPYRYGQAFLAYIGATYGDTVIMPMFLETAKYGYEIAMKRVFGYDAQTMSTRWRSAMENSFKSLAKDTISRPVGQPLVTAFNGGRMNVAPAISPDGRFLAFMSEKDLFGIDLFLADAKTGAILRKLGSRMTSKDIDEFSYLESAGDFSADSKQFAFSVFSAGKNKLMVVDVQTGKTLALEAMGDIVEFTNISFSPDGERVAFSGLKEGQSDIYTYNLKTKELKQLTNDKYSDFQPNFSPDGCSIVFSTDRVAYEADARAVDIPMNLALLDVATYEVQNIPVFAGANNLNPNFSGDGEQIYFLSNADGYRNMFRYGLQTQVVEQMTDYFTGISGITEYSPAISISSDDDVVYSYFKGNQYNIYKANVSEFSPQAVHAQEVNFDAAMLPPHVNRGVNIVNTNLQNFNLYARIDTSQIQQVPYRSKFKLDYLANSGVGMTVGSRYGAGMAGGLFGIFSDILGYNQIYSTLNVNGDIYDFGGQIAYINQRSRWNWGGAISHIPYMSGFNMYSMRDIDNSGVEQRVLDTYFIRTFQQQAEAFVAYPFNRHHRVEMGAALARYSYRIDRSSQNYFGLFTRRDRVPNAEAAQLFGANFNSFVLQQLNASLVGDKSVFGLTAPLEGFRYRLGVEQFFGDFSLTAYNLDLRRYFRLKPVTLAFRAYSYIRGGRDQNSLYQLYVAYPYLVRGFENGLDVRQYIFDSETSATPVGSTTIADFNNASGTKTVVGNVELRLPFTGPEKLAAIESSFLLTDLNLFFDFGLAWRSDSQIQGSRTINDILTRERIDQRNNAGEVVNTYYVGVYNDRIRTPLMSVGVSLRVNLFGAMILEPYYAIPIVKDRSKFGTFGLNFTPGW